MRRFCMQYPLMLVAGLLLFALAPWQAFAQGHGGEAIEVNWETQKEF